MSENEHCCAQLCSQRISEMIVCGINTYNTYMSVFFIHPASGHVGSTFARFPHIILEIMTWRRAIHSQYHGVGYQHRQYNRFFDSCDVSYSDLDWHIWVANLANCFVIICDCDVCVIASNDSFSARSSASIGGGQGLQSALAALAVLQNAEGHPYDTHNCTSGPSSLLQVS